MLATMLDGADYLQMLVTLRDNTIDWKVECQHTEVFAQSIAHIHHLSTLLNYSLHCIDIHGILDSFLERHLRADYVIGKPWTRCNKDDSYWREVTSKEGQQIIQLNILDGTFLVNGAPVKRLPESIEKSDTYRRIFGLAIFEVQRVGNGYITQQPLHNALWKFKEKSGQVYITQCGLDAVDECLLVPHTHFKNFPHALVHGHSHWAIIQENKVEFRPVQSSHPHFTSDVTYTATVSSGLVQQQCTGSLLVSVQSDYFTCVAVVFSRLDFGAYIHVYTPSQTSASPCVVLPRLGLEFGILNT